MLERLIARTDAFLVKDPGHAQALAWRGSTHFALARVERLTVARDRVADVRALGA